MKHPVKLLPLAVRATVILLLAGAFLVVLGIFDGYLGWDIFSPEVEKLLYGLLGSSVAVAAFGVAVCLVLGIQEVVNAFRKLVAHGDPEGAMVVKDAPRRTYTLALAGILASLVLTIAVLGMVDRRVEARRLQVFKLIAQDQMAQLGPRLAAEVARLPAPCEDCLNPGLRQFFTTMDGLSFCRSAVLYLPDPSDETVLWRYPSHVDFGEEPQLERFFIAKDDDRAVNLALNGDPAWIRQKNQGDGFVWYHVVRDGQGRNLGILQIWGNENESFREYQAVAEAAEKKTRS